MRRTLRKHTGPLMALLAGLALATPASADRPAYAAGDTFSGPAMALDGDTIVVRTDGKGTGDSPVLNAPTEALVTVRLFGIDAPEMRGTGAQGALARGVLDIIIGDRPVICRAVGEQTHGREVATCTSGDEDLAMGMISRGMAWTYRTFLIRPDDEFLAASGDAMLTLERFARRDRKGIWRDAPLTD